MVAGLGAVLTMCEGQCSLITMWGAQSFRQHTASYDMLDLLCTTGELRGHSASSGYSPGAHSSGFWPPAGHGRPAEPDGRI